MFNLLTILTTTVATSPIVDIINSYTGIAVAVLMAAVPVIVAAVMAYRLLKSKIKIIIDLIKSLFSAGTTEQKDEIKNTMTAEIGDLRTGMGILLDYVATNTQLNVDNPIVGEQGTAESRAI